MSSPKSSPNSLAVNEKLWAHWASKERIICVDDARSIFESKHTHLSEKMRCLLVDWMYDVVVRLSLARDVFFAAVALVDRYLCAPLTQSIVRPNLQRIGVACLWMCADMHTQSNESPELSNLLHICATRTCREDVVKIAYDIIRALDGELYLLPNPFTFMRLLAQDVDALSSPEVLLSTQKRYIYMRKSGAVDSIDECANAYLECAMLLFEIAAFFKPSTIARACYRLAKSRVEKEVERGKKEVEEGGKEEEEEKQVLQCSENLLRLFQQNKTQSFAKSVVVRFPWLAEGIEEKNEIKQEEKNANVANVAIAARKPTIKREQKKCALISNRDFKSIYETDEAIGSGAYGGVYKCHSKSITGLTVAVKKFHDSILTSTGLREISLLASLQHPNVVSAIEIFIDADDENVRIVMPLLRGGDLTHYIEENRNGKITLGTIRRLMRDVCRGLAYLHKNRVMHRDIKPSNIVVDESARKAMIIDLSISRLAIENEGDADFAAGREDSEEKREKSKEDENNSSCKSHYTRFVCTVPYRAPELLLGAKRYDGFALDMWSFGCTIGELALCSKRLIHSDDASEIGHLMLMFRLLGTPTEEMWPGVTSLPEWNINFPQWCPRKCSAKKWQHIRTSIGESGHNLLLKMLCYDPKQRISARAALKESFLALDDSNTANSTENISDSTAVLPFNEENEEYTKKTVVDVLEKVVDADVER